MRVLFMYPTANNNLSRSKCHHFKKMSIFFCVSRYVPKGAYRRHLKRQCPPESCIVAYIEGLLATTPSSRPKKGRVIEDTLPSQVILFQQKPTTKKRPALITPRFGTPPSPPTPFLSVFLKEVPLDQFPSPGSDVLEESNKRPEKACASLSSVHRHLRSSSYK